jgi:hypothetical protein
MKWKRNDCEKKEMIEEEYGGGGGEENTLTANVLQIYNIKAI